MLVAPDGAAGKATAATPALHSLVHAREVIVGGHVVHGSTDIGLVWQAVDYILLYVPNAEARALAAQLSPFIAKEWRPETLTPVQLSIARQVITNSLFMAGGVCQGSPRTVKRLPLPFPLCRHQGDNCLLTQSAAVCRKCIPTCARIKLDA